MREHLKQIITAIWNKLIGSKATTSAIYGLAKLAQLDLFDLAYKKNGILKYESLHASGEHNLIHNILPKLITKPEPVIFDVGAHQGKYSIELKTAFPSASVYAFEPNPATFNILHERLAMIPADGKLQIHNLGFSDQDGSQRLYCYDKERATPHASLYPEVFSDSHKTDSFSFVDCKFSTLDFFCSQNSIQQIDFLKLDTEGHEFACLKGATDLLQKKRLRAIQFEFNEMNIVSRTFLKDFFSLLEGYSFFRLDTKRLIRLGSYNSRYEIFQFQNILALLEEISPK